MALAYNIALLGTAIVESRLCQLPPGVTISREFGSRFAMGAETEVSINIQNATNRPILLIVKDEYPAQLRLNGLREGLVRVDAQMSASLIY